MSFHDNIFDRDVGEQPIDISASNRKFQQSIIVKQDPNKSGILSFLKTAEEETPRLPIRRSPTTIRVSRGQGEYPA